MVETFKKFVIPPWAPLSRPPAHPSSLPRYRCHARRNRRRRSNRRKTDQGQPWRLHLEEGEERVKNNNNNNNNNNKKKKKKNIIIRIVEREEGVL